MGRLDLALTRNLMPLEIFSYPLWLGGSHLSCSCHHRMNREGNLLAIPLILTVSLSTVHELIQRRECKAILGIRTRSVEQPLAKMATSLIPSTHPRIGILSSTFSTTRFHEIGDFPGFVAFLLAVRFPRMQKESQPMAASPNVFWRYLSWKGSYAGGRKTSHGGRLRPRVGKMKRARVPSCQLASRGWHPMRIDPDALLHAHMGFH